MWVLNKQYPIPEIFIYWSVPEIPLKILQSSKVHFLYLETLVYSCCYELKNYINNNMLSLPYSYLVSFPFNLLGGESWSSLVIFFVPSFCIYSHLTIIISFFTRTCHCLCILYTTGILCQVHWKIHNSCIPKSNFKLPCSKILLGWSIIYLSIFIFIFAPLGRECNIFLRDGWRIGAVCAGSCNSVVAGKGITR